MYVLYIWTYRVISEYSKASGDAVTEDDARACFVVGQTLSKHQKTLYCEFQMLSD